MTYLSEGVAGKHAETLKENDPLLNNCHNISIGNNSLTLKASSEMAIALGYRTTIVSDSLQTSTSVAAQQIVDIAKEILMVNKGEKLCLLFKGEPTIQVIGTEKGGRNLHLVMLVTNLLKDSRNYTFLSCVTDGTDGTTAVAGAVCDFDTLVQVDQQNIDIKDYIKKNNSLIFFM